MPFLPNLSLGTNFNELELRILAQIPEVNQGSRRAGASWMSSYAAWLQAYTVPVVFPPIQNPRTESLLARQFNVRTWIARPKTLQTIAQTVLGPLNGPKVIEIVERPPRSWLDIVIDDDENPYQFEIRLALTVIGVDPGTDDSSFMVIDSYKTP